MTFRKKLKKYDEVYNNFYYVKITLSSLQNDCTGQTVKKCVLS